LLQLAATLSDWCGPELLLLAAAVRPHLPSTTPGCTSNKDHPAAAAAAGGKGVSQHKQQKQCEDAALGALPVLLQAGLLPRVGRADELAACNCVKRGQYRSSLRVLMTDSGLLGRLPQELVRCLALTYWQQVRRGGGLRDGGGRGFVSSESSAACCCVCKGVDRL